MVRLPESAELGVETARDELGGYGQDVGDQEQHRTQEAQERRLVEQAICGEVGQSQRQVCGC